MDLPSVLDGANPLNFILTPYPSPLQLSSLANGLGGEGEMISRGRGSEDAPPS